MMTRTLTANWRGPRAATPILDLGPLATGVWHRTGYPGTGLGSARGGSRLTAVAILSKRPRSSLQRSSVLIAPPSPRPPPRPHPPSHPALATPEENADGNDRSKRELLRNHDRSESPF